MNTDPNWIKLVKELRKLEKMMKDITIQLENIKETNE